MDYETLTNQSKHNAAIESEEMNLVALLRPRVFLDGNKWCVLYGENIMDGVAGFGDSPILAVYDFNKAWRREVQPNAGINRSREAGSAWTNCYVLKEINMPFNEELPNLTADERAWREGWAFAYSGVANLYGDDGELQDNRRPAIDWMRDPPLEIRRKIHERAKLQWAFATESKEQLCRECGQPTMHMGGLCFGCGKASKAST